MMHNSCTVLSLAGYGALVREVVSDHLRKD